MLRRTKSEALDLPEKTRTWLPVETKADRARSLEVRALDYLTQNPSRTGSSWVTFLGLLNKARHQLAVAKASATREFVADLVEAGQKVVVFTAYQAVVDKLMTAFEGQAVSITGSHSAEERDAAIERYQQDPSVRVFVGNLHAAGIGITLTAGTHVVFNDLDWVPANHWQAEDRIHRIGQTQSTFATYIYSPGTLDEFVAALLEQKARLVGAVEHEAEERSNMVAALVDAALDGIDVFASGRTTGAARDTVGLLEETLQLLEHFAAESAGHLQQGVQVHTFPSSSSPGKSYTVEVVNGVARCDCPGFGYRGNCSHARQVLR
jgi:SWI/SNF-related matrix-associated actin-dependent regulator of chromatin subfamily A-like protein 1